MDFSPWLWMLIALMHSALFSGLNLGFFGVSRLKLVVQSETGNEDAKRILSLRDDAHLLLATLLWANVASNVLIALISDSMLTGVAAFLLSTFGITLFGEIFPQAYLAKHALRASIILVPIVKFYRILLYPVAKPTALFLDMWLGKETIAYFQENEMKVVLERHASSKMTDLAHMEALGAINFLSIDDVKLKEEGEIINPKSIIALPVNEAGQLQFPDFKNTPDDAFLQNVNASEEKWVVFTDLNNNPLLVLNADQFLRDVLYKKQPGNINTYCHRPIIIDNPNTKLGEVILQFKVRAVSMEDDVVDNDIILYWVKEKRIITGADILGRLLRGIVKREAETPGSPS